MRFPRCVKKFWANVNLFQDHLKLILIPPSPPESLKTKTASLSMSRWNASVSLRKKRTTFRCETVNHFLVWDGFERRATCVFLSNVDYVVWTSVVLSLLLSVMCPLFEFSCSTFPRLVLLSSNEFQCSFYMNLSSTTMLLSYDYLI